MYNPQPQGCSPAFAPGSTLQGEWHKCSYRIVHLLGQGANGTVYLVRRGSERAALKVGFDATALALEYNHLTALAQGAQGASLGPFVHELDDVIVQGTRWPVLAMEFVEGEIVDDFIRERGKAWVPLCLLRILKLVMRLHEQGHSFCDLKPANILIDALSGAPRFVDFGGVTAHGQAVKEFTETFDRAWWGRGSRKADPAYDVFALGMLGIQLVCPISPQLLGQLVTRRPVDRSAWLDGHLRAYCAADSTGPLLMKMTSAQGCSPPHAMMMLTDLLGKTRSPAEPSVQTMTQRKHAKRSRHHWDATDWGLLGAVLLFVTTLLVLLWVGRV